MTIVLSLCKLELAICCILISERYKHFLSVLTHVCDHSKRLFINYLIFIAACLLYATTYSINRIHRL